MKLRIECEQEEDGRWIAEIVELPGVLAYGLTRDEAVFRVQALGLRVLADRIEHGEADRELISFQSGITGDCTVHIAGERVDMRDVDLVLHVRVR